MPTDAVPEAPGLDSGPGAWLERRLQAVDPLWVAVALFVLALAVYLASNPARPDFYDHFVWQAHAFLQGRAEIEYPVAEGPYQNFYFQDVLPVAPGLAQIPFPPLPALVLLPFVAAWGLGTNGAAVAAVLGALNAVLCWVVLLGVTPRRSAALLGTLFYAFGTVAWYAAMLGTTWYLAHVVGSTFLFIAIALAVRADAASVRAATSVGGRAVSRQFAAGLAFGTAATARLTTILAAPFFVFVGGGRGWVERAAAAGVGALIPVLLLLGYNLATTGELFHPAYDFLYETEYRPQPGLVNADWAAEDPRYIPQNIGIMLGQMPLSPLLDDPACAEAPLTPGSLLDRECPLLQPDPLGMSLLLTSPAYLLAIPVLLFDWRRRLVAGAAVAVLLVALADLSHFSQGWVQFGYRFSNDFAPFAAVLVTLGIARLRAGWLSIALVALSALINAWGVYWGVALGW
ncbi:MAG: hypothetical protein AB1Z63_00905 [Candidatus Limnocylindrales bacterium]